MVTFLSGGTGTPKLLDGAGAAYDPGEVTVVANTGDDVEIGGLFVSPDVDTVLYQAGGVLDRDRWWGIRNDTERTHGALEELRSRAGLPSEPQFLPESAQTNGRRISRWRRFGGVPEFMTIGDRDRAVHLLRTSLLDAGESLTTVTRRLGEAFEIPIELLPMSDDPVASLIHTDEGLIHFQEYWIAREGEPTVERVEFRGSSSAEPTSAVLGALEDVVVIGPSNPVTSIGPMLALPGVRERLQDTTVVAVSPFVGEEAFSGPAGSLMAAVGADPSTAGLETAYPFADAMIVDEREEISLGVETVHTDIEITDRRDAARVIEAVETAIDRVT